MKPGSRHTRQTRAKMSAARKAALADPAVRAKMSAASKAAWADPAVRAKMSAASKAAWADPAVRAKMSAARKAAWADPAVRAKIAAARQAAGAALNPEQHAQIKAQIEAGATRAEIADQWLISPGYAYQLAKKLGARFFDSRQRFEQWAGTQTRLTAGSVVRAMGCSKATAYRWMKAWDLARGAGADQSDRAAGGHRPKTPTAEDSVRRVAATGLTASDPRRGPRQPHPWRRS